MNNNRFMIYRIPLLLAALVLVVCSGGSQLQRGGHARIGISESAVARQGQSNHFRKAVGVRYPEPHELAAVAASGYNFASVELSAGDPKSWQPAIDRAVELKLKVLAGIWPLPWRHTNGVWSATERGLEFLQFLRRNEAHLLGMYGFNEPYWTNPATGRSDFDCGFHTAADLRAFRNFIRSQWPAARIYHDLGEPSFWAPGGKLWKERPCIGNKYADQTGIADFAGVWWFPFETKRYSRDQALPQLEAEIAFIRAHMQPAEPVVVGQAFASEENSLRFPTRSEMADWNCALRRLPVSYLIWYPWRHGSYQDTLVNHPDYWPLTVDDACR